LRKADPRDLMSMHVCGFIFAELFDITLSLDFIPKLSNIPVKSEKNQQSIQSQLSKFPVRVMTRKVWMGFG
jgi:hypothetical protein